MTISAVRVANSYDDAGWHEFQGMNEQAGLDYVRLGDLGLGIPGYASFVARGHGIPPGATINSATLAFWNQAAAPATAQIATLHGGNTDPDNYAGRIFNRQTLGANVDFWKAHAGYEAFVRVSRGASWIHLPASTTDLGDTVLNQLIVGADANGDLGVTAMSQKFVVAVPSNLAGVIWRVKRQGVPFVNPQTYVARVYTKDPAVTGTRGLPGILVWSSTGVDLAGLATSYTEQIFTGATPTLPAGDYWATLEPLSITPEIFSAIVCQTATSWVDSSGGGTRGAGLSFDPFACVSQRAIGAVYDEAPGGWPTPSFTWPPSGAQDAQVTTPDISALVQAQIDAPWHSSATPLVYTLKSGESPNDGQRNAYSYEGGQPANRHALLTVDWTASVGLEEETPLVGSGESSAGLSASGVSAAASLGSGQSAAQHTGTGESESAAVGSGQSVVPLQGGGE